MRPSSATYGCGSMTVRLMAPALSRLAHPVLESGSESGATIPALLVPAGEQARTFDLGFSVNSSPLGGIATVFDWRGGPVGGRYWRFPVRSLPRIVDALGASRRELGEAVDKQRRL